MADRSSLSADLQCRIDRVYENLIGIKQQHQSASPTSELDAVFEAIDSNNDGVIDRDEYARALGQHSVLLPPVQSLDHAQQIKEPTTSPLERDQTHGRKLGVLQQQLAQLSESLNIERQSRVHAEQSCDLLKAEHLADSQALKSSHAREAALRATVSKLQTMQLDFETARSRGEKKDQDLSLTQAQLHQVQLEATKGQSIVNDLTAAMSESQATVRTLREQNQQLQDGKQDLEQQNLQLVRRAKDLEQELTNTVQGFECSGRAADERHAANEMRLLATKWELSEAAGMLSSQKSEAQQKDVMVQRLARELADCRAEMGQKDIEWATAKQQVFLVVQELELELVSTKEQLGESQIQVEALVANLSPSAAARSHRPASAVPAAISGPPSGKGQIAALFDMSDTNHDGVLDRNEFRNAKAIYSSGAQAEFQPAAPDYKASVSPDDSVRAGALSGYYVGADGNLI